MILNEMRSNAAALSAARPIQKRRALKGLRFLWLEITPGCNLRCRHCYSESSPLKKDPKIVDWNGVLADAYKLGCREVQFIGGEPVYHRDLVQYIATAHQLGYTFIEVYTNLTLVSERLLDRFRAYGVHVATSFYSTRREAHDAITGVRGSFAKTVRGIRSVVEGGIPLRVGITSMEGAGNEKKCIDFLTKIGVDRRRIAVDHMRPVGRAENLVKLQCLEETLCGHCWEGKLAVSWDGACYPCVFARQVVVGNVATGGLAGILRSMQLKQFRQRIFDYSSAAAVAKQPDPFGQLLAFLSGALAQLSAPGAASVNAVSFGDPRPH